MLQPWPGCSNIPEFYDIPPLERVKRWVQDCLTNHEKCNRRPQESINRSSRPRRILGLADNRVVLCLSEEIQEPFNYLTLSHMWGAFPEKQLRLVLSRVEEMQVQVHEDEMPEIYKTAIKLTRDLGYQYLWIDSLCIIQDSEDDWVSEAANMAEIYSHGICNLSFLIPPEAGNGQLWSDPRAYSPCILRPASSPQDTLIIRPYPPPDFASDRHPEASLYWNWLDSSQWPLFSRAWAFQEQFLCRRTIYYRHHHLAWECAAEFSDETLGWIPRPEKSRNSKYREQISEVLFKDETAIFAFEFERLPQHGSRESSDIWLNLVLEYRARHLTFREDRVMALAGVARRFSSVHRLRYLAGMYLQHMPYSLLWRISEIASLKVEPAMLERPMPNLPSWSWFSVPIFQVDRFVPAPRVTKEKHKDRLIAKVKCHQWGDELINTVPGRGFYDFSDLSITLLAVSLAATLQVAQTCADAEPATVDRSIVCPDLSVHCSRFYPDAVATVDAIKRSAVDVRLAILRISWYFEVEGLVLVPGSRDGTWKRLGYWNALFKRGLRWSPSLAPQEDEDVLRRLGDREKQELILV